MLSKHLCFSSLVSPVVTVSKLTLLVRAATVSQPKNICFWLDGTRVVTVVDSVDVAVLDKEVVIVVDIVVVKDEVAVLVPVDVGELDGQVSHLAGHMTAIGTRLEPSVMTVEHGRNARTRQSSGSATPLHSSLVFVVVAVLVSVVVNEDVAVEVGVVVAVVVGVLVGVVVNEDVAVEVGVVVAVDVGVLDAVEVAVELAVVVTVDVAVASQLLHMIGQRRSIETPNRSPLHSLTGSLLHAASSIRLLHSGTM